MKGWKEGTLAGPGEAPRVLLLLCEGFEVLEAAAFIDVLGWSGAEGGTPVETVTVGRRSPVVGTFGVRVVPDALLPEIGAEGFDALAIPGGFETHGYYRDAFSDEVRALVRAFDASGKPVASVCVGALAVAYAGVLAGRRGTTYAFGDGSRRRQLAELGATVADEAVVEDRNIITSTGPSTAAEVALRLLARLTGEANAGRIRQLMGFGESGAGREERREA